jgi:hypothetical protein
MELSTNSVFFKDKISFIRLNLGYEKREMIDSAFIVA